MITNTFIINLKSRPQRRHFALEQAKAYGLPSPRIIVASTPRSRRVRMKPGSRLSPPERACCVSHIRAWEKFSGSMSMDWILVLEDDAFGMVSKKCMRRILAEAARKARPTVDVINVGSRRRKAPKNKIASGKDFGLYCYTDCLYHAYLMRKRACALWCTMAWRTSKAVDKLQDLSNLKHRYCILWYRGSCQPVMNVPCTTATIKLGRGLFGQLRGGSTFTSDLQQERQKQWAKNKKNKRRR